MMLLDDSMDLDATHKFTKHLTDGIRNTYVSVFLTYFLLVGQKRGDGFYIGFQKMDYVYLYGSSVRMGHKVYIIPILLLLLLLEKN